MPVGLDRLYEASRRVLPACPDPRVRPYPNAGRSGDSLGQFDDDEMVIDDDDDEDEVDDDDDADDEDDEDDEEGEEAEQCTDKFWNGMPETEEDLQLEVVRDASQQVWRTQGGALARCSLATSSSKGAGLPSPHQHATM